MSKVSKMQERLRTPVEARAPRMPETKPTPNTFWDDAEALYRKSVLAIDKTHGELAQHLHMLINNDELYAKITDAAGLLTNVRIMTRDIDEHRNRLEAIHARHAGRRGTTLTRDDNTNVIQIHGQYTDALEIFENTIMPTVSHIFEQIGAAEDVLREEALKKMVEAEAKAKADAETLANPAVISDVPVKVDGLESVVQNADGTTTITADTVTINASVVTVAEGAPA